jgi:hypothetical protein
MLVPHAAVRHQGLRLRTIRQAQNVGTLKEQYPLLRALFAPNNACRHRLISSSYLCELRHVPRQSVFSL